MFVQEIKLSMIAFNQEIQNIIGWVHVTEEICLWYN